MDNYFCGKVLIMGKVANPFITLGEIPSELFCDRSAVIRPRAGRRGTVFNVINNFLQNLFIKLNIYTFAKSGVTYGQFVRETY